jgi:hypothetical protein
VSVSDKGCAFSALAHTLGSHKITVNVNEREVREGIRWIAEILQ